MRIPVFFGGRPGPQDAVLVEDGADMPSTGYAVRFALGGVKAGHVMGCVCCTLRGPAADSLSRMFRERATGIAPFFRRVVVLASPSGEAAVRDAIAWEVVTAARYRLATNP